MAKTNPLGFIKIAHNLASLGAANKILEVQPQHHNNQHAANAHRLSN
jgi:hypothetical protein